jgi:sarcosine oxidase delta subunit
MRSCWVRLSINGLVSCHHQPGLLRCNQLYDVSAGTSQLILLVNQVLLFPLFSHGYDIVSHEVEVEHAVIYSLASQVNCTKILILHMKERILVNWMLGSENLILHGLGDIYHSCIDMYTVTVRPDTHCLSSRSSKSFFHPHSLWMPVPNEEWTNQRGCNNWMTMYVETVTNEKMEWCHRHETMPTEDWAGNF